MVDSVKSFFRKKYLKKFESKAPTGILPMSQVKSAVAFIDVEDTSFDACKIALQAFFRDYGIKGEIFFFDFRKIGSEERLITSITNTVLKKDLDWCGKPSREKIDLMLGTEADLFISLIRGTDYPLEFMAKCSQAKFKVGRIQLPGNTFDLIVSDPADRPLSEKESFDAMRQFLAKIK